MRSDPQRHRLLRYRLPRRRLSAAAPAAASSSSSTADANAAASKYPELVRQLESYRPTSIRPSPRCYACRGLPRLPCHRCQRGVRRAPGLVRGVARLYCKVAAPVIALYLSLTAEIALYLDQREERSDTTIAQQRGTGTMTRFLCSGPQIQRAALLR